MIIITIIFNFTIQIKSKLFFNIDNNLFFKFINCFTNNINYNKNNNIYNTNNNIYNINNNI